MKQRNNTKQKPQSETIFFKIGGVVGDIAGKLSNQKDHLLELAGNAIESVKNAVHDLSEKKTTLAKKENKAAVKKVAKTAKPVKAAPVKKATPAKKALTAKKTAEPVKAAAVKKSAPVKRSPVAKKAVKKSAQNPVTKASGKAAK